jgi:hypothetical protein
MMKVALKRTAAALVALACLCAVASARQGGGARRVSRARADWQRLLAFAGRDVWELKGKRSDSLAALAGRLVPAREDIHPLAGSDFRPRLVERVKTAEGARVLLLLSPKGFSFPGYSHQYLYLFDEAGRLRGSSEFSPGWRIFLSDVRVASRKGLAAPLLVMRGGGFGFAFAPSVVAHFALAGDRPVLVRLERKDGKLLRNGYGCPHPSVGPPVPARTADEWARALASEDKVEVLEALVWVGGQRETAEELKEEQEAERRYEAAYPDAKGGPSFATLDECPGALAEAALYAEVRARADVRALLEKLSKSEDVWVRQAAELALKSQDGEWGEAWR